MALEDAPTVDVLKFDETEAYNHDRSISSLIRTQLLHLHHAEHIVVPPKARTNININHLLTERQASEYIQKVTRLLHRFGKTKSRKSRKEASRPKKGRTVRKGTRTQSPRTKAPTRQRDTSR